MAIDIYNDYKVLDINKLSDITIDISNDYNLIGKNYNLKEKYIDKKDSHTFVLSFFCNKEDKYYLTNLLTQDYLWVVYKCNVFKTYKKEYNRAYINSLEFEKGHNYTLDDSEDLYIYINNYYIVKVINIDYSNELCDVFSFEETIYYGSSSQKSLDASLIKLCYFNDSSLTFKIINEDIYKSECNLSTTTGVIESNNIYSNEIAGPTCNIRYKEQDVIIPLPLSNSLIKTFITSDEMISILPRNKFDGLNSPRLISYNTQDLNNINFNTFDYNLMIDNDITPSIYHINAFSTNSYIYILILSSNSCELHKYSSNMIFIDKIEFEKRFFQQRTIEVFNNSGLFDKIYFAPTTNHNHTTSKFLSYKSIQVNQIVLGTKNSFYKGFYLLNSSLDFNNELFSDSLIDLMPNNSNINDKFYVKGIVKDTNKSFLFVLNSSTNSYDFVLTNENNVEINKFNISKIDLLNNDDHYLYRSEGLGYFNNNEYIFIVPKFSTHYSPGASYTGKIGITIIKCDSLNNITSTQIEDSFVIGSLLIYDYDMLLKDNCFYFAHEARIPNDGRIGIYIKKYDLNMSLLQDKFIGKTDEILQGNYSYNKRTMHYINNKIYLNWYLKVNSEQNNIITIIDDF